MADGKLSRMEENVRKRARGVISQEFVVRLFGFFVMKRMPSIGAIDRAGRALTASPWTNGGRWKVRAARSGKSRVITNAHDPS